MKVTTEELQQLKSRLPEHIPQESIEKLLGMFPEGIPFPMAASLLENALRDLPEGLTAEQIAGKVMEKMQSQKKAASVDSLGNSKKITRDYFDSLLLEMRLMGSVMPSTRAEYFGETFDTPIMTTALSHLGCFHPDLVSPMEMYAAGAKEANALHWVGMCENEEFGRIVEIGARTVRIIKPYADEEKIYDQIRYAEKVGAIAVGDEMQIFVDCGVISGMDAYKAMAYTGAADCGSFDPSVLHRR